MNPLRRSALAALMLGVPRAVGIDIDDDALRVAAENARINAMSERLKLGRGGPETVSGTWPLVLANVLAAPYFDRFDVPGGDSLLVITTEVVDPEYLATPYWTSQQFKRESDTSRWNPTPCAAR